MFFNLRNDTLYDTGHCQLTSPIHTFHNILIDVLKLKIKQNDFTLFLTWGSNQRPPILTTHVLTS